MPDQLSTRSDLHALPRPAIAGGVARIDVARASDFERPARIAAIAPSTRRRCSATVVARASAGPTASCQANAGAVGRRGLPADNLRQEPAAELLDGEHNHDKPLSKSPSPQSPLRTRSPYGFLCVLGALCGEKLLNTASLGVGPALSRMSRPRITPLVETPCSVRHSLPEVQTLSLSSVRFVLASASPRRAELLASAGFEFDVVPADVDETPAPGEPPRTTRLRVARAKAEHVRHRQLSDGRIVLAADTVVVAGGRLMGKPADADDAHSMLKALSGVVHDVHTAVVVRASGSAARAKSSPPGSIQPAQRARDCLVSLDRRGRGKGRGVRHSGPRGAVHRADRRIVVERRRAADRDRIPAAGRGPW